MRLVETRGQILHEHITNSIASDAIELGVLIYSRWKQQSAEVRWQTGLPVQPFPHFA